MMAIAAFGPSKSMVVTFSRCSGAWRLNPLGGIEWGTSTEGERIYAAITNGSHKTYAYTTYDGQKKTTTGGLWTALDAATIS